MFLRQSISLLLLGLFFLFSSYGWPAAGQEGSAGQEQQGVQQAREQKAFALLEEIIAQAPALRLVENRVRIQAAAAVLIWKQDEKQARAIFKTATASLAEAIGAMEQSNPQSESMAQLISELRRNLIEIVAPLDPQLGMDILQATRQPSPPRRYSSQSSPDIEIQLEQRLAGLIAARDPQRTLQIARASLTKGLTSELVNTLSLLQSVDKEAASTLTQEIIARLKSENKVTSDAAHIAYDLAYRLRPQEGQERSFRELLNLLIGSALNYAPGNYVNQEEAYRAQNLVISLQQFMPEIEKYAPSQVTAIRQKIAELDRGGSPYNRRLNDFYEQTRSGTVEEALEALAKMPPDERGLGYQHVIRKATSQGDYDRARQIANSDVLEPVQRKKMLEEIDRQALWQSASQGRLNEARQLLAKLQSVEERASVLLQLAGVASEKNDSKLAQQFLSEAFEMVAGKASNYQHLQVKLYVAQAYLPFDPDRSFAIMTQTINQMNDLITAAATLDGFENNYLKNGEWMSYNGTLLYNMVDACNQQVAALARADFDRARSLADLWRRNEIQLKARLLIVQTLLSDTSSVAGPGIK